MRIILTSVFNSKVDPYLRAALIDVLKYYGLPGFYSGDSVVGGDTPLFRIHDLGDPGKARFEETTISPSNITIGNNMLLFPQDITLIVEELRHSMTHLEAELLYYARNDPLLPTEYQNVDCGEAFDISSITSQGISYEKGQGLQLSIPHRDNSYYTTSYERMKRIMFYERTHNNSND